MLELYSRHLIREGVYIYGRCLLITASLAIFMPLSLKKTSYPRGSCTCITMHDHGIHRVA